MARRKQRILPILGAAVGTGLAVYGISQGIRWLQRRQPSLQLDTQYPESSWPAERRYQPVDQPDREPIPATGPVAAAPAMTSVQTGEMIDEDTFAESRSAGESFNAETYTTSQAPEIVMDDFVAPLIEHAIAFNSVMNLLTSRQREGEGHEGTESLTSSDRSSMRAVLDQMQQPVAEYDEAVMRQNPLAERSHKLTRKLRDALDNLEYTGSDLFRINGEVRTELCSLVRDLEQSGQVTITGLEHIRQLYECQ